MRACTGGGRLAQPSLKILDKNANPEGKERTKKESVNHQAPAPHPQPQLYRLHSCRGKKWGDRTEEKKGRDTTTSTSAGRRGAGGGGGGGARPAEPNKAGLNLEPAAPGMGGQTQKHPLSRRWKTNVRSGSQSAAWKPQALNLGKSREVLFGVSPLPPCPHSQAPLIHIHIHARARTPPLSNPAGPAPQHQGAGPALPPGPPGAPTWGW